MTKKTFAGPFTTKVEAKGYLNDNPQNSVYSIPEVDAEGFTTNTELYYVENDDTIIHKIFGMSWHDIQARQARKY